MDEYQYWPPQYQLYRYGGQAVLRLGESDEAKLVKKGKGKGKSSAPKLTPAPAEVEAKARADALRLAGIQDPTPEQLMHFSVIHFGQFAGKPLHWILYHAAGYLTKMVTKIVLKCFYRSFNSTNNIDL